MIQLDKQLLRLPKNQFIFSAVSSLVSMIVVVFIFGDNLGAWLISATFLLFFSVSNNCVGLFEDDLKKYLIRSTYAFIFLLIGSIAASMLLSGVSIHEAKPYRTIYIVILISHFILIGMIITIKSLLGFLIDKDSKVK